MIGQQLPPFTLPLYPGNTTFSSTALIGHWSILHVCDCAFSAVTATELCLLAQFDDAQGTHIVSVCPDSMLSIVAWVDIELSKVKKMDISNISILSDTDHAFREQLGVGVNERAALILNRDCIVQAIIRQPAVVGINIGECERILHALQYAYETDGECTPADWIPGRPGIPPGASQIGKTWATWPTVARDSPL